MLDLDNNDISSIDNSIGTLKNLTWLNLKHNKISEVPDCFKSLTRLSYLNLKENPLKNVPNWLDFRGHYIGLRLN